MKEDGVMKIVVDREQLEEILDGLDCNEEYVEVDNFDLFLKSKRLLESILEANPEINPDLLIGDVNTGPFCDSVARKAIISVLNMLIETEADWIIRNEIVGATTLQARAELLREKLEGK